MTNRNPIRVAVCQVDEVPLGLGRPFDVAGKRIALFRNRSGKVFGVDGICPHKNGPLADGMLAGDSVVCPLHGFKFDSENGGCDQPGVCSITTYPAEVVGGWILVTVPK